MVKSNVFVVAISLFLVHCAANSIDYEVNENKLSSFPTSVKNVNARDEDGNTLLHLATDSATARYLLEHGADVNAKNKYGCTFLMYAVMSDSLDLVTLVLHFGADVNAQNNDGITPLMNAMHAGNLSIIKLLIAHGADITLRDQEGRGAIEYAEDLVLANASSGAQTIQCYVLQEYGRCMKEKLEL